MKPGLTVAAVLVLSLLLTAANQVFLGSPVPTALYALAVCSLLFFSIREEKKRRVKEKTVKTEKTNMEDWTPGGCFHRKQERICDVMEI